MASFDYRSLCESLEALYRSYGVLPRVIGRTVLGRAVFALDCGNRQNRTLLLCGVSGADGELCDLMLRFCKELLESAQAGALFCGVDFHRARRDCGVTVVPCLNPDGLDLFANGLSSAPALRRFLQPLYSKEQPWCANARGVELRRQFGAGFSLAKEESVLQQTDAPGKAGYPGEAPQSEAETQAVCALCRKERFRHALILEAGEPLLRIHTPPNGSRSAALCGKLLADAPALPLCYADTPRGAFADWFAQTVGRPAFTAQTGKGNAPLPEKAWFELLLLSVLL